MNSVDYEECAHKMLKINLGEGHEDEMCNMMLECCIQERTFLRFYSLLG
jgi:pre-mRNA-splicing factor CWC22